MSNAGFLRQPIISICSVHWHGHACAEGNIQDCPPDRFLTFILATDVILMKAVWCPIIVQGSICLEGSIYNCLIDMASTSLLGIC